MRKPGKSGSESRAQLYIKRSSVGPKIVQSIIHTKNLLQLKGIFEEEIEQIDIEKMKPDTVEKIISQMDPNDDFPVIFIQGQYIGTVSNLENWIVSGKIDSLLEGGRNSGKADSLLLFEEKLLDVKQQKVFLENELEKAKKEDRQEVVEELQRSVYQLDKDLKSLTELLSVQNNFRSIDLGRAVDPPRAPSPSLPGNFLESPNQRGVAEDGTRLVDYAFETSKWAVTGVTSAVSSVMSYFSWGSNYPSVDPPKEFKDFVDFTVIQVNWYWRQQKRILRLSQDRYSRLNPFTNELRSTHKYSNVKSITLTGSTFLAVTFNDDSLAEYYQTIDAEKIVKFIKSKCPEILIERVKE